MSFYVYNIVLHSTATAFRKFCRVYDEEVRRIVAVANKDAKAQLNCYQSQNHLLRVQYHALRLNLII